MRALSFCVPSRRLCFLLCLGIVLAGCHSKNEMIQPDFSTSRTEAPLAKQESVTLLAGGATAESISIKASEQERCNHLACLQKSFNISGTEFYLQGIAQRKYLWTSIYSLALYLPKQEIAFKHGVPAGAKMLVLVYHRPVEKEKIVASIQSNVSSNADVNAAEVKERFHQLTEAFDPPVAGSRYYFIYLPGRGTSLIHGGVEKVVIPGEDFADAFFGIWLSDRPGHTMRKTLLASLPLSTILST